MDRRKKRLERRLKKEEAEGKLSEVNGDDVNQIGRGETSDGKFDWLLAQNEDVLLNMVAEINKVFQGTLGRPAPFVSFVICGMQSSGKSTIMERFLNAPLNIVQTGTGTRCPLDTTCIHDISLKEPKCELSGDELDIKRKGMDLTTEEVFTAIIEHNKWLASEDRFSTKPLTLVYRASNVQNMRFVDTPGIIVNKSTGKDNREDIKSILRDTMTMPNAKLCVLVEPLEFSTNSIIDFCDETFERRDKWARDAIVVMPKFDKQIGSTKSGAMANKYFSDYHDNKLFPYLTITPTLASEDLDPGELFKKRQDLLEKSPAYEKAMFTKWLEMHKKHRETNPSDPLLKTEVSSRLGFPLAAKKMREVMLADTARRLPEVLTSLHKEIGNAREERKVLEDKKKFRDPNHLKFEVGELLHGVCVRIADYLDGDLEAARRLPQFMMDLEDELELENCSEWAHSIFANKVSVEDEQKWRKTIDDMIDNYTMPEEVNADKKYLGGKQFQRAMELFKATMIEVLPDVSEMKEYVSSGAGYLHGGLKRENWERAILSIVQTTKTETALPGVNFLIKHVGAIFRQLFQVALMDEKKRSAHAGRLFEVCPGLENCLTSYFDNILWELMQNAADKTHVSLEPLYSCLNPSLPGFQPLEEPFQPLEEPDADGQSEHKRTDSERVTNKIGDWWSSTVFMLSDSKKTKELLRELGKQKALQKKNFLPDSRTSMITDEETEIIITYANRYVFALQHQIHLLLDFSSNMYLLNEFKDQLKKFPRIISDRDWSEFISSDSSLEGNIQKQDNKIKEIKESIVNVQRMKAQF